MIGRIFKRHVRCRCRGGLITASRRHRRFLLPTSSNCVPDSLSRTECRRYHIGFLLPPVELSGKKANRPRQTGQDEAKMARLPVRNGKRFTRRPQPGPTTCVQRGGGGGDFNIGKQKGKVERLAYVYHASRQRLKREASIQELAWLEAASWVCGGPCIKPLNSKAETLVDEEDPVVSETGAGNQYSYSESSLLD